MGRPYVGVTSNVTRRLETHNSGGSVYTAQHRPWRLAVSVEFPTEQRALQFERYLKSGSGRAFARRRHLLGSHAGSGPHDRLARAARGVGSSCVTEFGAVLRRSPVPAA